MQVDLTTCTEPTIIIPAVKTWVAFRFTLLLILKYRKDYYPKRNRKGVFPLIVHVRVKASSNSNEF